MSHRERKEAYTLFWMIKGRLIPDSWDDNTIKQMYDDFFKRVWYNTEAYLNEDGFEDAYNKYLHE